MCYLLYTGMGILLIYLCAKTEIGLPDRMSMLILAILTVGEVISWKLNK